MASKLSLVKQFILDSVAEAKKVTWPTKKQLFEHSVVVVGALVISLGIIAALDSGLSYLVQKYLLGV